MRFPRRFMPRPSFQPWVGPMVRWTRGPVSNAYMTSLVRTTFTVLNQRLFVVSRTSANFIYDYGDRLKRREVLTLAAMR